MTRGTKQRLRPRWTLRLRLTLLYGALFLAAGAILLAITYALVARSIPSARLALSGKNALVVSRSTGAEPAPSLPPVVGPLQLQQASGGNASVFLRAYRGKVVTTFKQLSVAQAAQVKKLTAAQDAQIRVLQSKATKQLNHQRSVELDSLLTKSGVALGIMAFVSIGLGWLMAGRALRPVRTMSARARGISERNLHERLALSGPNDELQELGDTFDELLGRLETAFESQRRFVSNASHELRTPITLERTLVEVALADPQASVESLQDTCRRVLAAGVQQERLIEALLTLARSQRGIASREAIDLGEMTGEVIQGIESNGVRLERDLGEAEMAGDPRLVERLVANLLDNALKYNREHGWVQAWTGVRDGRPTLEVANTGPAVRVDQVEELIEPFCRLNGDRSAPPEPAGRRGLGLGLSIVEAISAAHGARLRVAPRSEGGLRVVVSFPPRPGASLD